MTIKVILTILLPLKGGVEGRREEG
jgi:hypothetical protein